MKGVDKKTKEVMDMLLNIDSFDLVSAPAFDFPIYDVSLDPREIEISFRKDKINVILRRQKIKYILDKYGSK